MLAHLSGRPRLASMTSRHVMVVSADGVDTKNTSIHLENVSAKIKKKMLNWSSVV